MILNVKEYIQQEKEKLKKKANEPIRRLLIIQVGNKPESNSYIKGIETIAAELGHEVDTMRFPDGVFSSRVYEFLKQNEAQYDGIMIQEPANIIETSKLSTRFVSKKEIINLIRNYADVDGIKPESNKKPATPRGIMDYLAAEGRGDLRGQIVAVVGKGKTVGKPLVPMLMEKGATVISCNSTTPDLKALLLRADIVIAATGVRNLIQNDMIEDGTLVIDAGISVDENGKLHGDCDPALYDRENVDITPVPGGVGLLTRLALMKNLLGK